MAGEEGASLQHQSAPFFTDRFTAISNSMHRVGVIAIGALQVSRLTGQQGLVS